MASIETQKSQSELFIEALQNGDFSSIEWANWIQKDENGQWLTLTSPDQQIHVDVNLGAEQETGTNPKFFISANVSRLGEITPYGEKHRWALNPIALPMEIEIDTTLNEGNAPTNITGIILVNPKFQEEQDDSGKAMRFSADSYQSHFGSPIEIDERGGTTVNEKYYQLVAITTGDKNREGRDNDGYFMLSAGTQNIPLVIAAEKTNVVQVPAVVSAGISRVIAEGMIES